MDVASFVTPVGGNLEVVISFDTTSSMYNLLDEIRGRVQDLIQRLQANIPGISVAVFAHGDYCDKLVYTTKWIDFTADVVKLCDFIKTVEVTWGGDDAECYELVLRQVRNQLSWTPGSRRVLVMIGDSIPHEPGQYLSLDWRAEVKDLDKMAVTIYGVQCGQDASVDWFYKAISMATGGKHLRITEFDSIFHTLMAVYCPTDNGLTILSNYEKEMRARCEEGGRAADIDNIFAQLRSDHPDCSMQAPVRIIKYLTPFSAGKKNTYIAMLSLDDLKLAILGHNVKLSSLEHDAKLSLTGHDVRLSLPRRVKTTSNIKQMNKKTTPMRRSNLNQFKARNIPRLKRENVPESYFNLRSLRWSSWVLACCRDYSKEKTEMWKRRSGRHGYRLKMLPLPKFLTTRARGKPALFEVAVQGRARDTSKKRYVVFSAFSTRCLGVNNWEQHLLGVARSQVDLVVNSGGRVFIRFCLVTTKSLLVTAKRNIRRYDYAWRKVRRSRTCPRDLVKGSFVISKSGL